jgi:DNA-directed RNA polymerase specialized sigma24 family protein
VERVVCHVARGIPREDVKDCIQATWLDLLRYEARGVPIRNLEALLVTIAKYAAWGWIDDQVSKKPNEPLDPELADPRQIENSRWARIWSLRTALEVKSPKCTPVFDLLWEGYSQKEIAGRLGVPFDRLRQQVVRCRRLMEELWRAAGERLDDWAGGPS